MWWIVIPLALAAFVLLYACLIRPNLPRRDISFLQGVDYAHRGLWTSNEPGEGNRPENSLAAFRAAVTPEFWAVFGRDDLHVRNVCSVVRDQFVVIRSRHTVDVLVVHPVAGGDGQIRLSDELPVLDDLIALGEVDQCHFVAIRNGFFCFDGLDGFPVTPCDGLPFCYFTDTGHDVVFFVE